MKYESKKQPLYDNCIIESKEGNFLGYTSKKKINFYIRNNLCDVVSPNHIRLNFPYKGDGRLTVGVSSIKRENICVKCGARQELTKHHVVPSCYKRHFPSHFKDHSSYDIVGLCVYCHRDYEVWADELKLEINRKYNTKEFVYGLNLSSSLQRWTKTASELNKIYHKTRTLEFYSDRMNSDTKLKLNDEILNLKIKYNIDTDSLEETEREVKKLIKDLRNQVDNHYKKVVDQVEDFNDFIIMWRLHFVEHAQPMFLPEGWIEELETRI